MLLSETLVGDLDAWNDQAWSWVGTEVSDAVWPSEEDMAAWVDQGERLAARLRGELGADFVVVFHPHFEAW